MFNRVFSRVSMAFNIVIPDLVAVIPDLVAVIPDLVAVIPDLIRDLFNSVIRHFTEIPSQARNDKKNVLSKKKGYTLIEITIVIVIMGLISMVGVPLVYEASQSTTIATQIANASAQGQFALHQMSREIRQVRINSSSSIFFPSSTSFSFAKPSGSLIRYRCRSGYIAAQTPVGTGVLADNVGACSFSYFDKNGQETSTVADIRYVKIDFSINIGNSGELPMQSIVYLRNSL